MTQTTGGAVIVTSLMLLGAAPPAPDAGRVLWSPYGFLFGDDRGCELRAALPRADGTWVIGSDCNRVDGHEIGSLVVLDADGGIDARPESLTLDSEADRDRSRELSELRQVPDQGWHGGWLAGVCARATRAPRHGGARFPASDLFQRYLPSGHRDRTWEERFAKTLRSVVGEHPALIDIALDGRGDLLVLAHATGTLPNKDSYLQTDPLWLLRVTPDGRLDRKAALDPLLAKVDLGYYEVLQVVPRPSGGAWITGRFPTRGNPHHRPQIYAVALTSTWALDRGFVDPLLAATRSSSEEFQIRLAKAGPDDSLVCAGEWDHPPRHPNIFRLTHAGALDPTFHPFAMPGTHPQGRFLFEGELAGDEAGNWLLSFAQLPGAVPPRAGPGLVRLGADGTLDRDFVTRLGLGLRESSSAEKPEGGGQLRLVVPTTGKRILLAGYFDRLNAQPVTSPLILNDDGSIDPLFHPHFTTELPPPEAPSSAKSSPNVPSDGKEHYLSCKKPGAPRATTYIYVQHADPWGHQPSCMIHYAGDVMSPGGGWQDCDQRVDDDKAGGAVCSEVPSNPAIMR